jgi:hypothetical protein
VLFGVIGETTVLTPGGPRPIAEISVGDTISAWDSVRRCVCERRVTEVQRGASEHLYALATASARLGGCTPGLQVYDAFEDMFRAAGSLSALAELAVLVEGALQPEPLLDASELTVAGAALWWLITDGEEGTLFIDGVLARHRVGR